MNHYPASCVVVMVSLVGACKPPEPTPSQYTNLGTEESPLLPTARAWHDPSVMKGTAEWRPFRKLSDGAAKTAAAKPTGSPMDPAAAAAEDKPDAETGGSGTEEEIRALVAEFNAALAENDLEKASEFLSDAQAEASADDFAAVHQLVDQLKLLQTAVPEMAAKIDALAPRLNMADALKMELQSVRIVNEKNATGALEGGAEARFLIGEEDLWYLESPVMATLMKERPRIEKAAKDIEDALANGTPDEAAAAAISAAIDELHAALTATSDPPRDEDGA